MINMFLSIFKMIIAILPFVVLCFVSIKVNLSKSERSKQFFMPIIALIYAVIAMLLMDNINDWLLKLIKKLPKWIALLVGFSWMPEQIGEIFSQIGLAVESLLNKFNMSFWIFFVSNTVIILVYLVIKKACIEIMSKSIGSDNKLHVKIASTFYEFFSERNAWCIKESYVQVRSMFKVFYYSAIALSTILMLVSRKFYLDNLLESMFYPVFGIIVIGELFFYLDGTTKREYTKSILGEDEDAYRIVNYSLLRKFLRSVFGDKLLAESTSINNALTYDITTDEIVQRLEKSDDNKVVCFAKFIDSLNKTGFRLDHNYIHSSLEMLKGKSVLFNNPFYHDLIPYAFYPMNRSLLCHKKVLVVLGRHSVEEDIQEWIKKGIGTVTNIPFMWNIGVLSSEEQDLDIGIVTRSDVLNIELHNINSKFLEQVGFIVIIEPSKLISTAQIGLNLLVKKCQTEEEKEIVYCVCDKNCDGLVDAMSHILMTSITEVSATNKHLGTSSYMCWKTDAELLHHRLIPNISRYLGVGTELSFAALKNQVSKTVWYGGEAFPVTDIRWIDKQYYYDLTKYASIPTNQEVFDECFVTSSNFWSAEIKKNNFITVEDESFNMFEVLRNFSTRTTEQGFINVISSEYLLKDYMADNSSIFATDAKAIPLIVADYTRSNRNTILRLILMMSISPVSAEFLEKELSLLGISTHDLKKQLWYELYSCYSELPSVREYTDTYLQRVENVYSQVLKIDDINWTNELIVVEDKFNLHNGKMETVYSIKDPAFLKHCVSELRSAGYISEDEKGQLHYLGAELRGHIYQKYLPGQFFTFGGKYYEMQYLTADGQILVRRAADHINGRPAYRQVREYTLRGIHLSEKIGAQQNIAGLKVMKEFADICVETCGYYRMEKYNDFANAKLVTFEGNGVPNRVYHNKEILCIVLPDYNGKLTNDIRYTITVLLNEIFKTIFAENQFYICAVTDDTFMDDKKECTNPLTYSVKTDGCELEKNAIYIIEDSQLDLGLTVAVERNLQRIFDIVQDYLDWHMHALEKSLEQPPEPQTHVIFTNDPIYEEESDKSNNKGKKGAFTRLAAGIKKLFGKKKKRSKKNGEDSADEPEKERTTEPQSDIKSDSENASFNMVDEQETINSESRDLLAEKSVREHSDLAEALIKDKVKDSEIANCSDEDFTTVNKPYHESYYMLYGKVCEPKHIDLSGTLSYVSELCSQHNSLKQARDGKKISEFVESTYKPGKPDSRYCDFCGMEIYGVEYETLADGRDRCLGCSRTAIKTEKDFRMLFEDVRRNMESFFGIRINAGIKVEMVNSKALHRRLGKAFLPTPKSDSRVLGVAIKDKHGYTLLVENGSPRMSSMLTMAHELTHIWQYINWNDKAIRKKYGKQLRLEIYEGMAKWVEVQYAYLLNEPATAKRQEILTSYRDDEYGRGFLRYRENYPFSLGTSVTKKTPFINVETPLSPEYCGAFIVRLPDAGINQGDIEEMKRDRDNDNKPVSPIITREEKKIKDRDPTSFHRYAYGLLSDDERVIYDEVLQAINDFTEVINTFSVPITSSQIQKIVDYIQYDHPEIFWFQHGSTVFYDLTTQVVNRLKLDYCLSKEETAEYKEKINMATKSFMTSVTDSMSDYEVVLHIYDNIIQLVDYDSLGLEKQKKTGQSASTFDELRSIYGVLVNKKAVCAGYAKAFQYLLNLCGIECTYVTNKVHAWNLVKLEGDYYYIDVTWGDFSNTQKGAQRSEMVSYDCFCITTEEVLKLESHHLDSEYPLPECTATKCNYYHRQGLCFDTYDFGRIRYIVCESIKQNRFDISFKLASRETFDEFKLKLIAEEKFREALRFASLKNNVRLNLSYSVSVREDRQIITFFVKKL